MLKLLAKVSTADSCFAMCYDLHNIEKNKHILFSESCVDW